MDSDHDPTDQGQPFRRSAGASGIDPTRWLLRRDDPASTVYWPRLPWWQAKECPSERWSVVEHATVTHHPTALEVDLYCPRHHGWHGLIGTKETSVSSVLETYCRGWDCGGTEKGKHTHFWPVREYRGKELDREASRKIVQEVQRLIAERAKLHMGETGHVTPDDLRRFRAQEAAGLKG